MSYIDPFGQIVFNGVSVDTKIQEHFPANFIDLLRGFYPFILCLKKFVSSIQVSTIEF